VQSLPYLFGSAETNELVVIGCTASSELGSEDGGRSSVEQDDASTAVAWYLEKEFCIDLKVSASDVNNRAQAGC